MSERLTGHFIADGEDMAKALAELFASMTCDHQADFFNEVANLAAKYQKPACFQWRAMEKWLTDDGKSLLREMNDHTECPDCGALNCQRNH